MKRRNYIITGVGVMSFSGCLGGGNDVQDSDGDGVIDSEDYAPDDPNVQEKSDIQSSGDSGETNDQSTITTTSTETPTETRTETPTPTPQPESEFSGSTNENTKFVDLRYRDYTKSEIEDIKSSATSLEYRDLFRNIDSYAGEYVTYTGIIAQVIEAETHFTFLIALNSSVDQIVYGSWTGERFLSEDEVELWAEVLGPEVYQTAQGAQTTVPAFAIADMQKI